MKISKEIQLIIDNLPMYEGMRMINWIDNVFHGVEPAGFAVFTNKETGRRHHVAASYLTVKISKTFK